MIQILYRTAQTGDVPALAALRSMEWGDQQYWEQRITGYMSGEHNPQQALLPRTVIAAQIEDTIVGFIAGHLTRRHECDGELEWINVFPEHRGQGVSTELLNQLWKWFLERNALKICVNVEPQNEAGRKFYAKHGATEMNPHWMVWQDIRQSMLI